MIVNGQDHGRNRSEEDTSKQNKRKSITGRRCVNLRRFSLEVREVYDTKGKAFPSNIFL